MMKVCKNLQRMKQKLESLKGKSRFKINLDEISSELGIPLVGWNYIDNTENYAEFKNMIYFKLDKSASYIEESYLDCETINTLPVFYIYFPLGTRWDDVLMDNFCIGIKSGDIHSALYCLETLYPLTCKAIFVSDKKPANLKPFKLITSSYRAQKSVNYKIRGRIRRKLNKIQIIKEIVI